jgi:hypothetical protein
MTADRHSVNRAFRELGLRFQWDERTWAELCDLHDVRDQLRYYLPRHQPHLLGAYDAEFLAELVARKLANPGAGETSLEAHAA